MSEHTTIPAPATGTPRARVPGGACDCHSHLFGPLAQFPPRVPSIYDLPRAGPDEHAAMRAALGVERGVIVQAAPYAQDPSAMLGAIAQAKDSLRGVGVADESVCADTLADWYAGGVRGLRFMAQHGSSGRPFPGSVSLDALPGLAPAMRDVGLHANIWAPTEVLVAQLPAITRLGVPIVIDHMAMIDPDRGPQDALVQQLVELICNNDVWLKLVLCRVERADLTGGEKVRRIHDLMVEACPERMLWGTDWPYVMLDPAPDAAIMLDRFIHWVADEALIRRILVENPARLYGFSDAGSADGAAA